MVLQLTPLDAFSPFQEKCAGHQPEIKKSVSATQRKRSDSKMHSASKSAHAPSYRE